MLDQLLDYVITSGSSDLHLSSGNIPIIRIDGILIPISGIDKIHNKTLLDMLHKIMNDNQKKTYKNDLEVDFAIEGNDNNRFRVNAFNNVNGPAAVFRLIPSKIMSLKDIAAPTTMADLCKLSKGLILVTGPTGSGKSTTLAAMIEEVNQNYNHHIITIEDPIEFIYSSNKSLINQREVGTNTLSFPNALRSALREDPDIIMVGELRDLLTIKLALTAAETGHLVLATLHTSSASESINRIIDVFPAHDKGIIRSMISTSLQAIISQRLLKMRDKGRCAAYEVMMANNSVRNLIREDKVPQIASMMEIGRKYGMITMRDSVMDLITKGRIARETGENLLISLGKQPLKE